MKAPRQFMALVAIAVIALFGSNFEASGQQTPNLVIPPMGLPTSLSIGSPTKIAAGNVTNHLCSTDLTIYTTNTADSATNFGFSQTQQWPTLDSWTQSIASNAYRLFVLYRSTMKSNSGIRFVVNSAYFNIGSISFLPNVMNTDVNLGVLTNISSNLFATAVKTHSLPMLAMIPVTGLVGYKVVVTNAQAGTNIYSYVWPVGSALLNPAQKPNSIGFGFPAEKTTTGVMVGNEWYCDGTNDVRITLLANGSSMTYTGDGDALVSGTVSISYSNGSVTVSSTVPSGSDVSFQGSTDLINWQEVARFGYGLHTRHIAFTVDNNVSQMFYRYVAQ